MTKTRVSSIAEFRSKYAFAHKVADLVKDSKNEPESEKRQEILKALAEAGYNYGLSVPGMVDPVRNPKPSDLDWTSPESEPHKNSYNNMANHGANASRDSASDYFFADSEAIIGQLDDVSAGKLVDNSDMRKQLSRELQGWYAGYEQANKGIAQAKGLEALVSSGNPPPKELREPVIKKIAEENARKTIEHYRNEGFNEQLQAEAGKISMISASIANYEPADFVPAAKALVADREAALGEFINETMSPRDYVIAGLNELAGSEDANAKALARDLVYAATD